MSREEALLKTGALQAAIFNSANFSSIATDADCHLYTNHRVQADLQLAREPLPLPKLVIKRTPPSLFDYRFEDFELLDYVAHGSIKAPIAV
jgi:thymidylate synthase